MPIRSIDDFTAEKVEVQLTLYKEQIKKELVKLYLHLLNVKQVFQADLFFKNRQKKAQLIALRKNTQNLKNILKLE